VARERRPADLRSLWTLSTGDALATPVRLKIDYVAGRFTLVLRSRRPQAAVQGGSALDGACLRARPIAQLKIREALCLLALTWVEERARRSTSRLTGIAIRTTPLASARDVISVRLDTVVEVEYGRSAAAIFPMARSIGRASGPLLLSRATARRNRRRRISTSISTDLTA